MPTRLRGRQGARTGDGAKHPPEHSLGGWLACAHRVCVRTHGSVDVTKSPEERHVQVHTTIPPSVLAKLDRVAARLNPKSPKRSQAITHLVAMYTESTDTGATVTLGGQ